MATRLATMISVTAGLLMIAAIACDSAPASPAPTQTPPGSTGLPTPDPEAPPSPTGVPTPDPGAPTGATPDAQPGDADHEEMLEKAQADLDKHRALWEAGRSDGYTFEYTPSCFCLEQMLRPVRITVKNGVLESVIYVESGEAADHERFERYLSIDGLFDLIQEAIDREAARLTASYDSESGYPIDVGIDYVTNIADEEFYFTATGYETEEEVAAELIRAVKLHDWEYADSSLAIDWSEPIAPDVMFQVIKWWYEDRDVHSYLEFECEDKRLGGTSTPSILTYSCYGTQDTLGDDIVTFSQVRYIPIDKVISIQHEFAHQTDFRSPARYVFSSMTIGERTKTSTHEDVRQQGGFDKVEASREEWKGLR